MPEGPEVARMVDSLQDLVGMLLYSINYNEKSKYGKKRLENHDELTEKLPLKILQIKAYGKKILFCLEENITIMSGLGMTGHWVYEKENNSNLWFEIGDPDNKVEPRASVDSKLVSREILYYDDARKFGNINIYLDEDELNGKLKKLGPDVLNSKVNSETWLSIFRKKKYENKEVHDVIRNDACICGVGNYLRAEILYRSRINPFAKISDLSDAKLEVLRKKTHKVIRESYAAGGLTIESFWDAYGKKGLFKTQVYRQDEDPKGREVLTFRDKLGFNLYYVKY